MRIKRDHSVSDNITITKTVPPLKISRVTMLVAGLSAGGQERHMSNLANEFSEMGISVQICCFFKTENFWTLHPNIKVCFPESSREGVNRFKYGISLIPYIRKSIKEHEPQVILSFGEWFNSFSVLSTLFSGVPIYLLDLMGPAIKYGFIVGTLRYISYPLADGVIVQTNTAKEIVQKRLKVKNVSVVPNPLNEKNISPTIVKKKQIVSVGRLSKEKGHEVLLRAFAKIKYNDWTLHLVGDGNQRNKLESLSAELEIKDRVVFHGYQSDFDGILGASQIFVLPSFYEGFPNALIEAMSVPLACIASNCIAGPADIIDEGKNGFLFPPGDDQKLSEVLTHLIENPQLIKEVSKEAYKIREELKSRKVTEKLLNVIMESVNEN